MMGEEAKEAEAAADGAADEAAANPFEQEPLEQEPIELVQLEQAPLSKEFYKARKAELKERVSERRFRHILGVASTSKKLAKVYGVNTKKAKLAGLLHDWDKCYDDEGIRARAAEVGLEVPEIVLQDMPQTLHGMTAALALARDFPTIPEDVIHAISVHTTACIDMSPLDMVVNIADCLEPGRKMPEVEELRALVGKVELEELFFLTFGVWIKLVLGRKTTVYPETVDVWNYYALRHKQRKIEERKAQGLTGRAYDPNAVMDGSKAKRLEAAKPSKKSAAKGTKAKAKKKKEKK